MIVLLGILRVIGWILLILLLLILALLLFILISPIRYESTGAASREKIQIRLKVDWLLKILRVRGAVSNDKILVEVKALWFSVYRMKQDWQYPPAKNKEKDSEKTEAEEERSGEPDVCEPEIAEPDLPEEGTVEPDLPEEGTAEPDLPEEGAADPDLPEEGPAEPDLPEEGPAEPEFREEESAVPNPEAIPSEEIIPTAPVHTDAGSHAKADPEPESETSEPVPTLADRLSGLGEKAEKTREGLEKKAEGLVSKLEELAGKVEQVRGILDRKDTWDTVNLGKRILIRILKHILPREGRIHATVGTGDPALTGELLGLVCVIDSLTGEHTDIRLKPVFDDKVLQGKYYLKGRIRLGVFVVYGVRLLLNRNIRRLIIRKIKGEES